MNFNDMFDDEDFDLDNKISLKEENLYRLYSNYYYNLGFNITCIGNVTTKFNSNEKILKKSPNHEWIYLIKNRQELNILKDYCWGNAIGLGVILGFKNFRAIDIDGCKDLDFLKKVLNILDLPETYEWVVESGSGNGFHIIFMHKNFHPFEFHKNQNVSFLPNENNFKIFELLELRWVGHLVSPPSLNFKYKFVNTEIPISKPLHVNMYNIEKLIKHECKNTFVTQPNSGGYSYKLDNIPVLETRQKHSITYHNELIPKLTDSKVLDTEFLILDTETNGLPNSFEKSYQETDNWPNIIQLAYYLCDKNGKIKEKKHFYISPQFYNIDKDTLDFLTIDYTTLKDYGIPIKLVLKQFEKDLSSAKYVIGHNIDYDINVIQSEFLRNYSRELTLEDKILFCTMKSSLKIASVYNRLNGKYPKLNELYEILFKEEPRNLHNAINDVEYTYKCFLEIIRLKQ